MSEMSVAAKEKAEALTRAVTEDDRWALEDELMCQVFGFTMFGYVFGYGRIVCIMEVEEIKALAANQLTGIGIGPKYAEGMMDHAFEELSQEGSQTIHAQLVGIGHSHFASEDITELVNSIFQNTEQIRSSMGKS